MFTEEDKASGEELSGGQGDTRVTDLEATEPAAVDAYEEYGIDHLVWLDRALIAGDAREIAEATRTMKLAATAIKAYALAELLEQMNVAARKDDLAAAHALVEPLLSERAVVLASLRRAASGQHG